MPQKKKAVKKNVKKDIKKVVKNVIKNSKQQPLLKNSINIKIDFPPQPDFIDLNIIY